MHISVSSQAFGIFENKQVMKYCIAEKDGLQVCIINYGATVTNIFVKDNLGNDTDVVLGFENIEGYLNGGNAYMGCICGRYANRISNGKFTVNKEAFLLNKNNGESTLHGGIKGFDKVFWDAEILPNNNGVTFSYNSKDGEEGFAGNLTTLVTYTVANNALHIEYKATSDKPTPINLTNHTYFNLSGGKEATILNHYLQMNANNLVEIDEQNIPTGKITAIKNTAFDFTTSKKIGSEMKIENGYDHCWVLDRVDNNVILAATLYSEITSIKMLTYTTEPSVQFYTGNFLDGNLTNTKQNTRYNKYAGLCLEAQHFPDSPNHIQFPTTILHPNEVYYQETIYSFTTK